MIRTNMDKAREIARGMVRARRAPMLAALDVEMIRAIEAADTARQAEIAARKQALRDAPDAPEIQAAATPDALKSAVSAVLA